MDRAPDQFSPCLEGSIRAARAHRALCRNRVAGRPDASTMDGRQSEARPHDRPRYRRADCKRPRAFHRRSCCNRIVRPEKSDRPQRHGRLSIRCRSGRGRVGGRSQLETNEILGTHQNAARNIFVSDIGSDRSDLYSLGVIAYELLNRTLALRYRDGIIIFILPCLGFAPGATLARAPAGSGTHEVSPMSNALTSARALPRFDSPIFEPRRGQVRHFACLTRDLARCATGGRGCRRDGGAGAAIAGLRQSWRGQVRHVCVLVTSPR